MGDLTRVSIGIGAAGVVVAGTEQTNIGGALGANLQLVTDELLVETQAAIEMFLPVGGGDDPSGQSQLAFHLALLGNVSPDVWLGGQLGTSVNVADWNSGTVIPTGEAGVLFLAGVTDTVGFSAAAGIFTADFQDVSFTGSLGVRLSWDLYDASVINVGSVADRSSGAVGKITGLELIETDGTNMFVMDPLTLQISTDGPADVEIYIMDANGNRVYDLGIHPVDGLEELSFLHGKDSLRRGSVELKGRDYRVVVRVVDGDGLQYGTQPFFMNKARRRNRP